MGEPASISGFSFSSSVAIAKGDVFPSKGTMRVASTKFNLLTPLPVPRNQIVSPLSRNETPKSHHKWTGDVRDELFYFSFNAGSQLMVSRWRPSVPRDFPVGYTRWVPRERSLAGARMNEAHVTRRSRATSSHWPDAVGPTQKLLAHPRVGVVVV
ncbi:hypothetical protein GW17_00053263 [Ensete ventricosum]|nr:hypothetical protein GW17_00053263 [Ensete ventricosum]